MATQPTLLRTVLVANMPDPDWAATQVAPAASICAALQGDVRIGAVFVAYDAAGAVVNPSGTVDLALVDVASTVAVGGIPSKTLVKTTPVDSAIPAGAGLAYDVAGSSRVTLRVAAKTLGGTVTKIEIYWNSLEQG